MAYDSSNGLSAVSAGLSGAAEIGGAYEQSTALEAQGEFQATMARINREFARRQADQVLTAGNEEAAVFIDKGKRVASSQRASAAAQGLDVNDSGGTVADQVNDTYEASMRDAITVKNNAWKQAWGITTNANIGVANADFNQMGNRFAADQTLATGGIRAAGNFTKATAYGIRAFSKNPISDRGPVGDYSGIKMPTLGDNWWDSKEAG